MSALNSIVMRTTVLGSMLGLAAACGAPQAPQASQSKIVGGEIAQDRPFMAGLVERSTDYAFCGGTFISETVVMTAAHCVADGWQGMRVAGGHRLNKDLTNDKTVTATDVVVHEHYDANTNDNDIALVFLKSEELGRLGGRVKPAHNSDVLDLPETAHNAIVSGWGSISSGGTYPDELREVTVPIITNAQCKSAGGYYDDVNEREVCAGDWDQGGIDSCQGDSGGPLFVEKDGKVEVIGIVSWGEGCADKKKPGVYSRVASHKEWITTKVTAHNG